MRMLSEMSQHLSCLHLFMCCRYHGQISNLVVIQTNDKAMEHCLGLFYFYAFKSKSILYLVHLICFVIGNSCSLDIVYIFIH